MLKIYQSVNIKGFPIYPIANFQKALKQGNFNFLLREVKMK